MGFTCSVAALIGSFKAASAFILALLILSLYSAVPAASKADKELLTIIKTSCQKACVGGRGKEAFCSSYCQCVSGEIEKRSDATEISQILKTPAQQDEVIQICSGQTALGFFDQSCREKCAGVPRCNAYCGCLSDKIQDGRKLKQVGAFFIELGKNQSTAVQRLKGYEAACTK